MVHLDQMAILLIKLTNCWPLITIDGKAKTISNLLLLTFLKIATHGLGTTITN